jgi:arylformamidase
LSPAVCYKHVTEIIDISVPIRPGMVTYPGDPAVVLERVASLAGGDVANISRLDLGVHTGTHIDAPLHFVEGGAAVDTLPLDVLVGAARVIDLTGAERLDAFAFDGVDLSERVLLKTRNSRLWERDTFSEEAIALDGRAAQQLVDAGVRLVGIDYLSIGDEEAHQVLLGAGVVPVEGLDLRGVEAGDYQLVCAPLKLVGSDGAPARAFLIRN